MKQIITNTDHGALLFEIQRGVCAVGCHDCYERSVSEDIINWAVKEGHIQTLITPTKLSTSRLYQLQQKAEKIRQTLPITTLKNSPSYPLMNLDEITSWFSLMQQIGLTQADLIGSETTKHPQFKQILDTAQKYNLNVLVYTGRLPENLDQLHHPAIKDITLHLDYTSNNQKSINQEIYSGKLPSVEYIQKISSLLDEGKEIGLRINFPYQENRTNSVGLLELVMLQNILTKLSSPQREKIMLKYSFSTKIDSISNPSYFALHHFNQNIIQSFLDFVNYFNQNFPEIRVRAERPLFRCAFSDKQWEEYQTKAGLRSTCEMEIAAYPGNQLGLCTVTRDLAITQTINNVQEFAAGIQSLKDQALNMYTLPSFPQCEPCSLRTDLTCYGGCSGYKINKK